MLLSFKINYTKRMISSIVSIEPTCSLGEPASSVCCDRLNVILGALLVQLLVQHHVEVLGDKVQLVPEQARITYRQYGRQWKWRETPPG